MYSSYIEIGRETNDLDFLARKVSNEVAGLKYIFEEIANIDLKDWFLAGRKITRVSKINHVAQSKFSEKEKSSINSSIDLSQHSYRIITHEKTTPN